MLLAFCAGMQAREVTGSVISGKEKLSGVVVTDGKNFTLTDKKGKFRFDIDDKADFVYIVTPSGYVAPFNSGTPAFYLPASHEGKFIFDLKKISDSEDYTFIAIADSQTATEKHFGLFQTKAVPDVLATIEEEDIRKSV